MWLSPIILSVAALLYSSFTVAVPVQQSNEQARANLHARRLLGSSFGVPGNQTFDYIVIGGGTAGLTIASRLAEQHAGSVAVIEAGSFYEVDNSNLTQIPANDAYYVGTDLDDWQPGVDWGFHTTPQAVR